MIQSASPLRRDRPCLVPLMGKDKGRFAIIDPADAALVFQHKWYLNQGYASTTHHRAGRGKADRDRNVNLAMHRLIMGEPPEAGLTVHHKNWNRLDNRRSNLEWLTLAENTRLSAAYCNATPEDATHGYLGVHPTKEPGHWRVRVSTTVYGQWPDKETAARVYDTVVRRLGLAKQQNFPDLPDFDQPIPNLTTETRRAARRSEWLGVSWFKPRSTWRAICKGETLGYFQTEEEAVAAARTAFRARGHLYPD